MATKRTASLAPSQQLIVSGQVVSADLATSAVFNVPNDAEELTFLVQSAAKTGTTPTVVTALQTSPDGGTTWRFTGNNTLHSDINGLVTMAFSRQRHAGQAAEVYSADAPAVGAANAAKNGPVNRKCRLLFRLGGSASPAMTMTVWMEATPSA